MPTKSRKPTDKKHINIDNAAEMRWWVVELNATQHQIKMAVYAVGDNVDDVRRQLMQ